MKRFYCFAIVGLLWGWCAPAAPALTEPGTVREVTVYRDQALVTRVVDVPDPAGMVSIVVTDLPPHIIPDTLSAETTGANRIHAVTFRSEAVGEETRPEVLKLDKQIQSLERTIRETEVKKRLANGRRDTANRLNRFTAQSAQKELEKGTLKSEEIKGLAEYCIALGGGATIDDLHLDFEIQDLRKEVDLLRRKRAQVAVGTSRQKGHALIHLNKSDAGPVRVKVRYLVSHVGWSPHYNVRAGAQRDRLRVEYNAQVRQMSGENWTKVALSFSTAQPSFACEPPELRPVRVKAETAAVPLQEDVQRRLVENTKAQKVVQTQVFSSVQLSERLNDYSMLNSAMELNADDFVRIQREVRRGRMEGVSVTYPIDQPVSLPSRNDEQILPIAVVEAAAMFKHIAAPALTDFVYESATARNASAVVLLPGSYSSYMNGEFVGRGEIPMVAKGEKFQIGFGADPQVQILRELVSRDDTKSWGKRVSAFDYKIALSNYSPDSVTVELTDRIPWSDSEKVEVRLLKTSPDPDRGTEARKKAFAKGLMTWDLTVPGNAFDDKAVAVAYSYRLTGEFPPASASAPERRLVSSTANENAQVAEVSNSASQSNQPAPGQVDVKGIWKLEK